VESLPDLEWRSQCLRVPDYIRIRELAAQLGLSQDV
jgi:hypothetical protein